jgi:hypothetical protein
MERLARASSARPLLSPNLLQNLIDMPYLLSRKMLNLIAILFYNFCLHLSGIVLYFLFYICSIIVL